jgi:hypothetical protein
MRFAIHGGSHELSDGARLALCGGIALYLVGHAGFRLRLTETMASASSPRPRSRHARRRGDGPGGKSRFTRGTATPLPLHPAEVKQL